MEKFIKCNFKGSLIIKLHLLKDFENYENELLESDYQLLEDPVSLMQVNPITLKDSNEVRNHIVVCGIHPSIYYFLLPLRAK